MEAVFDGLAHFFGLALCTLILGHLAEILHQKIVKKIFDDNNSWTYDFRFYSLIMMGVLLAGCGIRYLWAVRTLSREGMAGRRITLTTTLFVLVIVVPLIPIQPFFATVLSSLGFATLLILLFIKAKHIKTSG